MKYVLQGIETERLKFRLLEERDFDTWVPLFETTDAPRFLGLDLKLTPEEMCQFWFDKVFNRYSNDLGGLSVLMDKKTGKFIGQCGLLVQSIEGKEYLEVGYSILPDFWGKGYASEAAVKCKNEGFRRSFSEELISTVHVDNIGSATVAQRNGMKIFKSIKDYEGMPVNIFMITKAEWEKSDL